ncbi:MAG: uracil-DNA glycosylase family protein [bacterium]|jgi:hypothetical protein
MIEQFSTLVPEVLRNVSGSVFYSGRAAFAGSSKVYVLGANPGGDPIRQREETVQSHMDFAMKAAPELWSAYCDESWTGRPVGRAALQCRVQHLLSRLGLDPRLVPASNLVFSRSRRLENLDGDYGKLADLCWPFHAAVIKSLRPKGIICFGADASRQVASRVGATKCIGQFRETYPNRSWTNRIWKSSSGLLVFELTHPSSADWTSPYADPSPMVKAALEAFQ